MGVMDKAKARAEAALAKGKEGMAQGQAKLDAMQAKKQGDGLLRDLGAAYFAQQRSGGSAEAVSEALAKVDAHIAEHGAVDTAPTMPTQSSSSPGETGDSGASYNLDDM
jgi:hypothetical protein